MGLNRRNQKLERVWVEKQFHVGKWKEKEF